MGTYNGIYRLGSLFGMLLGGIFADLYGLSAVSTVFGLLAFAAIPLAILYVPDVNVSNDPEVTLSSSKDSIWKNNKMVWVLIVGLLTAMLYQGVFTAILSHVVEIRIPDLGILGITIGAASVAGLLQALRWSWEPFLAPWVGRKSDGKVGRHCILVYTLLFASIMFACIPLSMPITIWLSVLLAIQVTATIITTIVDALASDTASIASSKVAVMTSYSITTDLGAALGPIIGFWIVSSFGTSELFFGSAVVLLLICLSSLTNLKKRNTLKKARKPA